MFLFLNSLRKVFFKIQTTLKSLFLPLASQGLLRGCSSSQGTVEKQLWSLLSVTKDKAQGMAEAVLGEVWDGYQEMGLPPEGI